MRHLAKGIEPVSFTDWKAQENDEWKPEYSILCNPEKRILHESLLHEQFFCCCYCGRNIELEESHIEHFRPQSDYIELELDYQNLHASCIRSTDPETPLHCGHKKGNWFDEASHLSPLDALCEQKFQYLLDGRIQASDASDTTAIKMIETLALNIAYLNNRRQETILGLFDDEFLESASHLELTQVATKIREPQNGRLTPFSHVIARFAEQRMT